MNKLKLFAVVFLAMLTSLQLFAQEEENAEKVIGKLYDKAEAEELFGPVLESVEISSENLEKIIAPAKYAMFNIINGKLYILDKERALLNGTAEVKDSDSTEEASVMAYNAETVFSVYSKSMVDKLVEKGGEKKTYVQKRKNNLTTLGNGAVVLELTFPCPPNCP